MTRSSRHKSSKHSSREARDYSDSEKEKDSSAKERKSKDDGNSARVSKESGSGSEKRKFDSKESKDVFGSGNGDYSEEYSSSSKRRKDRVSDDGVSDRWNGGGEDDRIESSRKSKGSSESKSKKRDDSEEPRSKSEGKHKESSRKESREAERERKGKEGKNERFVESEKTESSVQDRLPSPESENQIERRVRRRRDSSGDGDKIDVNIGDSNDRQRDGIASDGRLKDEKHKDERYREKYKEELDRDGRHRDDKQRDERSGRDHPSGRSDDKHLKNEKDTAETRQKKSKLQEIDRDREREYDYDRDHGQEHDFEPGRHRDRERGRDHDRSRGHDHSRDRDGDREWDRERSRERDREWDRDRDRRDRDRDCDRDHERERERERDRNRDRDRDIDHDRDRDLDNDGSHNDDGSFKYKDNRGKKRSPDDHDDFTDTKSRGVKAPYSDMENRSLSSRVDSDADRGRSQSRHAYVDSTVSSNRRRTSPSPSSQGGTDDYRHLREDLKHRDPVAEQRPKGISSKEVSGFSGVSERGSRYRSTERTIKTEDGHLGELSVERSSSLKASPMGLMERSPSSTSLDRRYMNRNGSRRSLDIEETGRRSSVGPRELSVNEDRLSRDLPLEKPLMDESSQMDLLYYNRTSQSNSSSQLPPPSAFRAGIGSPSFMSSLEEDGRVNIGARYRRSVDPNIGRGQGNTWRGAPNWSSPLPNGFIPFQHGPPHGGYPAMMSQFPSPSIFGVRPQMEMNTSGIPYHIHDADRFAGHLRPLGWQNMMDGSGPPHLHGWDGNNGGFRDEPHMYGGADWEQHRHPMNGRGWETGPVDMWKGENGDVNMDLPSTSQKDDNPMQGPADDVLDGQASQQAQIENNNMVQDDSMTTRSISSVKESSKSLLKTAHDEKRDPSKISSDNVTRRCCAYLSKLDISVELAGPELYSQCMSLLDVNQTITVDKDSTIILKLKDGGIAVPKGSKALFNTPLFPAANDSVFQRAMNHYKKQRVQISGLQSFNGGIEMISTSHVEKVEQESLCNVEKAQELALTSDIEILNAPSSTADQKKPEPVLHADVQETVELVSIPSQAVQDLVPDPLPNLQVSEPDSTPKSFEEPVPVSGKDNKMEGMTAEQVISEEDAHRDHSPSLDNAPQAATLLPTDGDNMGEISKTKGNNSNHPAKERQPFGDENSDPLLFNDGSPRVSGVVMPGSNESESVILSRIHHSPESTH